MRRITGLLVLVSCLCAPVAVAGSASRAPARLRQFSCRRSVTRDGRRVEVTAVMRPVAGTQQLQLRFRLLARPIEAAAPAADGLRTATFSQVHGGDLGHWISPTNPSTLGQRPGDVWVVKHPVAGLPARSVYRFEVDFRWIGTQGRMINEADRISQSCREPGA